MSFCLFLFMSFVFLSFFSFCLHLICLFCIIVFLSCMSFLFLECSCLIWPHLTVYCCRRPAQKVGSTFRLIVLVQGFLLTQTMQCAQFFQFCLSYMLQNFFLWCSVCIVNFSMHVIFLKPLCHTILSYKYDHFLKACVQ